MVFITVFVAVLITLMALPVPPVTYAIVWDGAKETKYGVPVTDMVAVTVFVAPFITLTVPSF